MDYMSGIWKVGAKAKGILNLAKEGIVEATSTTTAPAEEVHKVESPVQDPKKRDEVRQAEVKPSSSPESEGPDSKPATPETPKETKVSNENIELDEASAQLPGVDLKQVKDVTKDVSQKAVEGAKYFGSFLYNVANKAGKTVTDTASKIKHTVEENSILGDFNKEQEAFVSRKQSTKEPGVAPWTGCVDEDAVKQQVLSLSADKRNFVRSPPSGVSFQFSFDEMHPVALVMLKEDPNLEAMRFDLVPKHITEENFWRNYFYRVSLVKQSASLAHQKSSSGDSSDWSKNSDDEGGDKVADDQEVNALGEGVDKMGRGRTAADNDADGEEEWEKELHKELQDFEVVNEDYNPELENELDQMIATEPSFSK